MPIRVAAIAYTHYESDPRVRREAEILARRGDDVTVWCLRREGQAAEGYSNGVRLLRIDLPRYRGSSARNYVASYGRFLGEVSLSVYRQHRKRKFDLVHVHTMPDFLVVAGLLPKLSGAKVVLDMHDLMPDLYALKFGLDREGRVVSLLRGLERLSVAFSDHAICVHEPQQRLLVRDGVPKHKLSIVMNAPDPVLFAERPKQPSIKGPDGEIRMIYHGTVLHRFGVDLAVRALAEARKQNPRLRLQIIGDGDFLPDIRRLAAELGLDPPALEIIGQRLPLEEVARIVREAHLGIVPNRDDQEDSVLPNKLLEYVSVGIPVIATRTRCITHYFGERELELVPIESVTSLASAMVRLSRDRERRRELITAAKAWESKYGGEVQRRALLDVVDVVTTGHRIEEPLWRPDEALRRIPSAVRDDDDDAVEPAAPTEAPVSPSGAEAVTREGPSGLGSIPKEAPDANHDAASAPSPDELAGSSGVPEPAPLAAELVIAPAKAQEELPFAPSETATSSPPPLESPPAEVASGTSKRAKAKSKKPIEGPDAPAPKTAKPRPGSRASNAQDKPESKARSGKTKPTSKERIKPAVKAPKTKRSAKP
ncbi:MAG: glycosyltransferase [Deltaproteobacteria bacterium]|nr:glycosyltransferase [Deltaproteobacteria bacterium]